MKSYKHNMGVFLAEDHVRIFYQSWTVANPKGIVLVSHGLGEHSGRYENLMNALDGKSISFYAIDHRGHGKSGGKRGHVDSYMNYINDFKQMVEDVVKKENGPGVPVILLGHSMGGLIAAKYALTHPGDMDALILSAAALIPAVKVPEIKKIVGKIFNKLAPRFTLNNELDPNDISHDKDVVRAYIDDPLVHGLVSARWYSEYLATAEEVLNRVAEYTMPLLVIHGTGDKMVSIEGTKYVYEKASSKDKTIHTFDGLFHETMNESGKEKEKVLKILSGWILDHMKKPKKK